MSILRCTTCVPDDKSLSITQNVALIKPGIFNVSEIEQEKLNVRSRKFCNLTGNLVRHDKSELHLKNAALKVESSHKLAMSASRNRDIGYKIGSLAYFFFYNKLPFVLFEKFLPWHSIHNIDIGHINHSDQFSRRLVEPCYNELLKRLRIHMRKPLPCTGEVRPVTILADKGTINHDTLQLTMIKTLCLKKGVLFERFFIDNPDVVKNDGLSLSELLINSVCSSIDLSHQNLRQSFTGCCFDGQYIHLNFRQHLSNILSLPLELMDDSITHDAAHRLELACKNTKEGKVSRNGQIVVPESKW